MKLTKIKHITTEDIIGVRCDCCSRDILPETGYWHVEPSDRDYCTDDCLICEFLIMSIEVHLMLILVI